MGWNEGILDAVLVPLGLSAMVGYHIWLYMQIRRKPMHTVVGVNHMNRRAWVKSIMKVPFLLSDFLVLRHGTAFYHVQ